MTYIVSDACIRCKYTDCVAVCPVDCFREGVNMLVIDPDECIDCGVCVPECPANAIHAGDEPQAAAWLDHNARYAKEWPEITQQIPPPADADDWKSRQDKMAQFSPAPAERAAS
jgi:ferredoxin